MDDKGYNENVDQNQWIARYQQLYDYHKGMADYHYKSYEAVLHSRVKGREIQEDSRAVVLEKKISQGPLKLSFPQIIGLKNSLVEQKINELLKEKSYGLIEKQKKENQNLVEILGEYQVKLNKKGLLSIYFTNYAIWEKAAHGLTLADSLTVDLDTGQVYELNDFFKPNSDYISRINQMIKQQIQDRNIPLITDFKTIAPEQSFFLNDQGIVIYFQLYKYTPYYLGIPQFIIPYKLTVDLMAPAGPLVRLV
ncbi:MAG: DUF3298 and DUF4163 domain-containing protein [Thermotaleaceae bacterium]